MHVGLGCTFHQFGSPAACPSQIPLVGQQLTRTRIAEPSRFGWGVSWNAAAGSAELVIKTIKTLFLYQSCAPTVYRPVYNSMHCFPVSWNAMCRNVQTVWMDPSKLRPTNASTSHFHLLVPSVNTTLPSSIWQLFLTVGALVVTVGALVVTVGALVVTVGALVVTVGAPMYSSRMVRIRSNGGKPMSSPQSMGNCRLAPDLRRWYNRAPT